MTTIFTLLRGNEALTQQWVGVVNAISKGFDVSVVAVMPNDASLPVGLNSEIEITVHKIPKAELLVEGSGHGQSCSRTDVIVDLYNKFLPSIEGDRTLMLEDDITPPSSSMGRLGELLKDKVKCAVGVYPYKGTDRACFMSGEYSLPTQMHLVDANPFKIWAGGFGFALWDTRSLKEILPIKRVGECIEWDHFVGFRFKKEGWEIWAHGSVICKHG